MSIMKVSKRVARRLDLGRLAAVTHEDRTCLVRIVPLDSKEEGVCELDQTIRHALAMPGYECYGTTVQLHPVRGRIQNFPLVQPRSLTLPTCPTSWLDSEKNICVLHPRNIDLLGVEEGEYVEMLAAVPDNGGRFRIKRHTSRVFRGTSDTITRAVGEVSEYPRVDEVYVDLDGRTNLGIPRGVYFVPVIIRPSVRRLFVSRLLFYGVALFLGMDAILALVQEVGPFFNVSRSVGFLAALVLAGIVTSVFSILDIRGKVQY